MAKGPDGFVDGVVAADQETGQEWTIAARVVINATGAFSDSVRRLAEPDVPSLIAPSQGIHLVFHHSFLSAESAIMVPHTSDGRVMFAIPWHQHTLVGTTDTPITTPTLEPRPVQEEIDFILETASQYLLKRPTREDVLSVFVGIRPLVKSGDGKLTAALSRDHTVHFDASGLMTTSRALACAPIFPVTWSHPFTKQWNALHRTTQLTLHELPPLMTNENFTCAYGRSSSKCLGSR